MKQSSFFKQNARQVRPVHYPVSQRFTDEQGNAIEWELRCITAAQDEQLRRACTMRTAAPGKGSGAASQLDVKRYLGKLAVTCVVQPNLNDAQLQADYGVMGGEELIKVMLNPGEYAQLQQKIQELNGFDRAFQNTSFFKGEER
jgi:hypothetical protein